ncbi:MAG: hypothetical protein GY875_21050 [Gammaproteobacteria bacterium]|nr:hypothetical protein [Gammaproteobacteria bacterium]
MNHSTVNARGVCLRWLLTAVLLGCQFSLALAASTRDIEFTASTPYQGRTVMLHAELFRPDGNGPHPAVVLMHGCGGLSPPVQTALRSHAKYLVEQGYAALVLDSFGPRKNNEGWVCKTFDRLMAARRYRTADALDALKYLQSLDFIDDESVFQLGQSNGASVSIRLSQLDKPAFRASAAFYPWCGSFNRLGSKAELTSPLIVLTGALDDWTPPGDCQTVKSTGAEYKLIVYPGAVHSFDLQIPVQEYLGHKVGHDPQAALDSRIQMLNFFSDQLSAEMKAGMPVVVQSDTPAASYLGGDEIRRLMPSGKLRGVNAYGNPFTITYTTDGGMSGVAGKSDEYRDSGKWWVRQDSFCRQYQSWLEGKAACFRLTLDGNDISFYDEDDTIASAGSFER